MTEYKPDEIHVLECEHEDHEVVLVVKHCLDCGWEWDEEIGI